MAIPSGAGTEVLKQTMINTTDATEGVLINGVANHIYTVLTVIWCEKANNAELCHLYVKDDGGNTDYYIIADGALGAYQTFVFNDRLVITGTDELATIVNGTNSVDIICSYIDQDWT